MGWEVCAPALRRLLVKIHGEYSLPPIILTENGAAFKDEVSFGRYCSASARTSGPQARIAHTGAWSAGALYKMTVYD